MCFSFPPIQNSIYFVRNYFRCLSDHQDINYTFSCWVRPSVLLLSGMETLHFMESGSFPAAPRRPLEHYTILFPKAWKFLISAPDSYFSDIRHKEQKCSMIQAVHRWIISIEWPSCIGYVPRRSTATTSGKEMKEPWPQRAYQRGRNTAERTGDRNDIRENRQNGHRNDTETQRIYRV